MTALEKRMRAWKAFTTVEGRAFAAYLRIIRPYLNRYRRATEACPGMPLT